MQKCGFEILQTISRKSFVLNLFSLKKNIFLNLILSNKAFNFKSSLTWNNFDNYLLKSASNRKTICNENRAGFNQNLEIDLLSNF